MTDRPAELTVDDRTVPWRSRSSRRATTACTTGTWWPAFDRASPPRGAPVSSCFPEYSSFFCDPLGDVVRPQRGAARRRVRRRARRGRARARRLRRRRAGREDRRRRTVLEHARRRRPDRRRRRRPTASSTSTTRSAPRSRTGSCPGDLDEPADLRGRRHRASGCRPATTCASPRSPAGSSTPAPTSCRCRPSGCADRSRSSTGARCSPRARSRTRCTSPRPTTAADRRRRERRSSTRWASTLAALGETTGVAVAEVSPARVREVRERNPALALRRYRVSPLTERPAAGRRS